jgi:arylsulfatase A-like enzyme
VSHPRRAGAGLSFVAAFLVVAAPFAAAGCRRASPAYDNLVLVTVDTLRADHLGLYGYRRPVSPFLDQLGREGVVFWQAIASSSHTAPSHATILTSLQPEQHGVLLNGQTLPDGIPTLATLLRAEGIETAAFVSVRFLAGLKAGFETFDASFEGQRVYRPANETVDLALAWLRRRDRHRRFALWVHVYDAHQHVVATDTPAEPYRRILEDTRRSGDVLLHFLRQEQCYPLDEVSESIQRYDAQVLFVDQQLRRLMAGLAEIAPPERTLRVITADHGEGLGNHGYEGHGRHLYNEQVRVPLIVTGDPKRLRPWVYPGLVRHVDLMPTVAELLGVRLDRRRLRIEGRSLVPLMVGKATDVGIDAAFSQRRPPDERRLGIGWEPGIKLAAQDGRFKYIMNAEGPDEFYDLKSDGCELRNLIDEPRPEKDRLRRWLEGKYQQLRRDHRGTRGPGEVDPRVQEDLKALGYI